MQNKATKHTYAWKIGQMMLRRRGVTRREALEVTNWPSISMRLQAKRCGLKFTKKTDKGEVRYFAKQ